MSDYSSNFAALLTGHLGLPGDPTTGGGKGTVTKGTYIPQGRNSIDDNLDIRDALSHVVAGGYTDFSNEDVKANYKYISKLVGAEKAEKLFIQAFQFNKNPGMNKKGGEEKVQAFYDLGSADPETSRTLSAIKNSLGSVKEGYRNSINEGVRLISGADTKQDKANSPKDVAAIQSAINTKTTQ